MTKETKKSILYSIAFSPIFLGGLLLVFGYASDLYSQEKLYAIVKVGVVVVLSVFVTASLVFYNKQAYDQNPDSLYKIDPRFVDHVLIVSLWFFGAIGVLFIDRALHLEIYFQTITALAVMYVLLVAFRIDRLVRRTAEEEELTLDLMGKARYWRTIYQRDVEAILGGWNALGRSWEKIEEIVIKKYKEYQSSNIKNILSYDMGKKFAKELADELAETPVEELDELSKELGAEPLKEFAEEYVKELTEKPLIELVGIFGEKYVNKLAQELYTEFVTKNPEEVTEELTKKSIEQLAKELKEGLFGKTLKELAEMFAEKFGEKYVKELNEEFAKKSPKELAEILAEELVKKLIKKPPKELAKELVEKRRKNINRQI